jgi:hypothetical protein
MSYFRYTIRFHTRVFGEFSSTDFCRDGVTPMTPEAAIQEFENCRAHWCAKRPMLGKWELVITVIEE